MLEYENMRSIEYNGYYYFISWEYRKNTVKVEKFNSKLEILSSISFDGYNLIDCFVENEKLIVVYTSETSDNQVMINSVTLKTDNLDKINTSKKIVSYYVYKSNKKLYYDRYSTYYKLDNDYNIVSELSFKDGTQIILDSYNYKIAKTNVNNKIEKATILTPSNEYSATNLFAAINNDKLYIALVSYKYDSTNSIYNHQIEYFEYNKNLELKNTYVITETSTSYRLSGGQIYVNNNGVFTSYNNKYYKINSDFSFTESTSGNMYSNFEGEGYDEPKASEDVEMLEAISLFTYNFVDDLEEQAEDDNFQENTNVYAYSTYSFDYYYDKDNNEIKISGVKFGIFNEKNELLEEIITNENGEAQTGFYPVYNTKYYIQELETNEKYQLNSEKITIELKENETTIIQIENQLKRGKLEILKIDCDTNEPLENIEFEVYDFQNQLIGKYKTDKDGKIIVENLKPQKDYYIKEIKTQEAYKLLKESIKFNINPNETTNLKITNEKIKGKLKVIKVDKENKDIKLEGVSFDIYDEKSNLLETITTDKNGCAYSSLLPSINRIYAVFESKTLPGYIKNEEYMFFKFINPDTYEMIVANEKIKEEKKEVPKEEVVIEEEAPVIEVKEEVKILPRTGY